jgi:pimeloyl-ACP methyl ester carboxylesterase
MNASHADPPIRHHVAQVNGLRMHYASCGDESRPLLLFVHGFPEFWREWEAQLRHFGRDHHAVAPDTRGINETERPLELEAYRARHMVEDLRALIAHLGQERCVLVGHDWGGAICWAFAMAHAPLLRGMVMINAVHPGPYARELAHNPAQQAASAYMNFFRTPEAEEALMKDGCAELLAMFADDGRLPGWFDAPTRAAYLAAWSQPGSVRAGLNYYRASPLHPPSGADPADGLLKLDKSKLQVSVPTLVIWGERDRFLLPGCLDGLDEVVPNLRIERIAQAGHWVVHEQPQRINRLIADFVAALP